MTSDSALPGVTLVGGGPGAWDLITVRGMNALVDADVILTDHLGPTDELSQLCETADKTIIDVSKLPYGRQVAQEETNRLLVEHALAGRHVVRLKGGDPYVFGRGHEELEACREHAIPCAVVPGVTSAISVPGAAGIPVTQRGVVHSFTVVSGHLPPGHPSRRPLVDRVIMELVRHAAAEEQVLHPATRQLVPDGDDLVEHEHAEHAEVEELMRRLESPEIPDEEYEATLDALIPLIRTHLREEERVLFPRLVEAASSQELRELGRLAGATIRRVPTRPHPSVPDEPPFDRLFTPDASLVERTRDLMTE